MSEITFLFLFYNHVLQLYKKTTKFDVDYNFHPEKSDETVVSYHRFRKPCWQYFLVVACILKQCSHFENLTFNVIYYFYINNSHLM